jgi:histidine triad (HIT) family protein
MNDSCLFCKIAGKELESDVVYEDDHILAFRDIDPQAPIHVLIIPKMHVATSNDFRAEHAPVLSELLLTAAKIARDQGVEESGYRVVMNCQEGAGQSVFHVHLHLLGGRPMAWPPG